MAKISTFIIALVVVSLFASVFSMFITRTNDSYGELAFDGVENATQLNNTFNKLNELSLKANEIENKTNAIKETQSIVDIVGGYFSSAYNALAFIKTTYEVFGEMAEGAFDAVGMGETSQLFKRALLLIVLIIIIVGILLSSIIKREL